MGLWSALRNVFQPRYSISFDLSDQIAMIQGQTEAELFKTVHEAGGGCGGMSHLAGDVCHGQLFRRSEVAEQEELSKGDVISVQLTREIKQKLALTEQDEICQFGVVFGGVFGSVNHGGCP